MGEKMMKTDEFMGYRVKQVHSQQFNSNVMMLAFAQPARKHATSARALLSYLMAVSSTKYPSQQAVSKELMELYGASYSVKVLAYGNMNLILFSITFVKEECLKDLGLSDQKVLEGVFDFLRSMAFGLDFKVLEENPALLSVEKQNLIQAILSRQDDKVAQALDESRVRLFEDEALQESILGDVSEIEALSVSNLEEAYAEMLNSDERLLFTHGAVQEDKLRAALRSWPLKDSLESVTRFVNVPRLKAKNSEKIKVAGFQQAVTIMNYQLPVKKDEIAAALVLNSLFGAGPSSLLFTEVREKESLAYNISSRLQVDLNLITVLAECRPEQAERIKALVGEQLVKIQGKSVEPERFSQAKQAVLSDRIRLEDHAQGQAVEGLLKMLAEESISSSDLLKAVEGVSLDAVSTLAKKMVEKTSLVLSGQRDDQKEEGKRR
ncbi:M16 family metallopeptidase [Fructobacillus sp. CRL 2054]|uniref:M16 family metallopeptidase n=1 Tax=Fructobacillus sp. CRL 2054 TaxID=2763007 RepID=UPI00237829A3|nr:insulinase family protein [Fructobacillus sp. CRL 2054]